MEDAQCDKLANVVGRTKMTGLATFDRRLWTVCRIEQAILVCVQHNAREAARRAGPSVTAETCFLAVFRGLELRAVR